MRILYMLTKQFRSLLVVQSLMRRGMAQKQVASEAGLHPFVAGKCMRQCPKLQPGSAKGYSGTWSRIGNRR